MRTLRSLSLVVALTSSLFVSSVALVSAQHDASGEHETAPAGAVHGEHHEEGEAAHEAPHWDYVRLAGQLTNFAIWAFLIYKLLNGALPKFLATRKAGIVDGLEEAKQMKLAAETKYAEYSKRIDNMDAELTRVREDMKKAGLEERDRLVKEASDKSEKMRAEARFLIDQQMKELKETLTREAIESAVTAAERILRERTTAADQQRLANEYLDQLKSNAAKAAGAAR